MFGAQQGLRLFEHEDITAAVQAALREDDDRKRVQIDELVPNRLRPMFEEFAGLTGGQIQKALDSGDLVYLRLALKRTP